MAIPRTVCPVCKGKTDGDCETTTASVPDALRFLCTSCGTYELSGTVMFADLSENNSTLSNMQRAILAHVLRQNSDNGNVVLLDSNNLKEILSDTRLPSVSQQATILIRAMGDYISSAGADFPFITPRVCAVVGVLTKELLWNLRDGLVTAGLIVKGNRIYNDVASGGAQYPCFNLSLEGWERYEREKKGGAKGTYGFVAMQFGDTELEPFMREHVKPAVIAGTGYELIDVRQVARAGVIDNILREQIRDAAFVLVDLTHDNSGAYWEAGYAEGLGKPVIYLCEKKKFEEKKTHFDTNHSTTVIWDLSDIEHFKAELVATVRRSLNLF